MTLRQKLPGHRVETLITADRTRELFLIHEIRGFMDELIEVKAYWLKHKNGKTDVFTNINDAAKAWESLTSCNIVI